jgi:hypothetical protein
LFHFLAKRIADIILRDPEMRADRIDQDRPPVNDRSQNKHDHDQVFEHHLRRAVSGYHNISLSPMK